MPLYSRAADASAGSGAMVNTARWRCEVCDMHDCTHFAAAARSRRPLRGMLDGSQPAAARAGCVVTVARPRNLHGGKRSYDTTVENATAVPAPSALPLPLASSACGAEGRELARPGDASTGGGFGRLGTGSTASSERGFLGLAGCAETALPGRLRLAAEAADAAGTACAGLAPGLAPGLAVALAAAAAGLADGGTGFVAALRRERRASMPFWSSRTTRYGAWGQHTHLSTSVAHTQARHTSAALRAHCHAPAGP